MSDDEELLYGLLGTQFNTDADEQTEFKRSKLKRKAAEEEVVDAKGRATRFHGAFTGGFSAGYFNTVGSKEGFQPTDFVSQGKTTARNYRPSLPEDFMDDEDFNENGIAPRLLRTKSIFDNEDIRSHMKQSLGTHDVVGDCDILKDILVPQCITIGLMLLRKLGYLASRGVGEKANIRSSSVDDEDTCPTTKFDYEAEDTFQLIAKTDKFGLGYSGMNRELISAAIVKENRGVNFGLKGKKGIRGVAFGGVDEDDDDDDLRDIFAPDSISKYNLEYIEDEKDSNFGWTAPKNLKNSILPSDSIPGFQMGTKCTKTARVVYAPPDIPRFYLPIYPIRREEENKEFKKKAERPKLMPNEDVGSIFNLLSSDDRKRLLNMGKGGNPKKSESRWGEARENHVEKQDITANLLTIRNSTCTNNTPPPPPSFETPRKVESKKQVRQSWERASNLSSKFKSAGYSTATQDNDCLMNTNAKGLELSTKELAANSETYGFMTRTHLVWHPDKLLCKRFNVPDPYPSDRFVGVPDEVSYSNMERRSNDAMVPQEQPIAAVEAAAPDTAPIIREIETENEETSSVEIMTIVPDISDKPPIDLFKAVFDDSDAEFSSSEDEMEQTARLVVAPETPIEVVPVSIVSSMEAALGAMFGGTSQGPCPPKVQPLYTPKAAPLLFGPTPPPNFVYNPVVPDPSGRATNDIISKSAPKYSAASAPEPYEYMDKSKVKKKKHEKKSKKSKSNKKDKVKKKSKKKKSSTSDDSE